MKHTIKLTMLEVVQVEPVSGRVNLTMRVGSVAVAAKVLTPDVAQAIADALKLAAEQAEQA